MRKLLILSALCLSVSATTYGSTFSLVNNTFVNGATATGSVDIDTTTGVFNTVNVNVLSGGINYLFTGAPAVQSITDNGTQYFEYSLDSSGNALVLDVPGASLIGYAGGNLCSVSNLCGSGFAGYFGITTGPTSADVTPLATGSLAAQTPEPSSLMLLGTGFLGVVGAARRRFTSNSDETSISA